jgi:putative ABC transport system ATP-binding protein
MSILRLSHVTKSFGSGAGEVKVMDDVDFELMPQEVVAVMGPSGSGKTTFLTICGALQKPTSGVVEVDGQEIQNLSQIDLAVVRRHKIGFVFQSLNLLEALSAKENVEYALKLAGYKGNHCRERAKNLLAMMDLTPRQDELPKKLSGGERQRVGVARALANDGNLILADEPTASLDEKRATDLMRLLVSITRDLGRSVLLVTHDMRAHDHADRIFWLEGGKLEHVEHGDVHLRPHKVTQPV